MHDAQSAPTAFLVRRSLGGIVRFSLFPLSRLASSPPSFVSSSLPSHLSSHSRVTQSNVESNGRFLCNLAAACCGPGNGPHGHSCGRGGAGDHQRTRTRSRTRPCDRARPRTGSAAGGRRRRGRRPNLRSSLALVPQDARLIDTSAGFRRRVDRRAHVENACTHGTLDQTANRMLSSSYTASLASSAVDYPVEHGRRYHAFRPGSELYSPPLPSS